MRTLSAQAPMLAAFRDLLLALALRGLSTEAFYDRLAPRYDRAHARWLRAGGAETVAALRGCLSAELRTGSRVLDAGCGTGALARWILAQEPGARITQFDSSPAMLARAAAVPGRAVLGCLTRMPFADAAFDIVVCAWALETLDDTHRAIRELLRVLAPGGLLCVCHCTRPLSPRARRRTWLRRAIVTRFFRGRFLSPGTVAALADGRARQIACHDGLSSFLCLRKPARDSEYAP